MSEINVNYVTLEGTSSDHSKFCKNWPLAKQGLELLLAIVKNPIVKGAIRLIISAGDAIAGNICH